MMYEDYLEHHGIKGMRWGHRKQRMSSGFGVRRRVRTNTQQPQTPEEAKRARRRKIAKRVAIGVGAAAAIGATAYAVHRVKRNHDNEISAFKKVVKNTSSSTKPRDYKEVKTHEDISKQARQKALNRVVNKMGRKRRIEQHLKAAEHYAKSDDPKYADLKFLNEHKDMYTPGLLDRIAKAGLTGDRKTESELIDIGRKSFTEVQKSLVREQGLSLNKYVSSTKPAVKSDTSRSKTVRAMTKDRRGTWTEYNVDDFTQELLKKNAKRLARAGY